MSPAVGGELPAVVAETLRHLADRLLIGLIVGVRSLIGRVRPVSENTLISCESEDSSCAAVGEVRVLCDKVLQKRDEIVGADGHGTVIHHHLTGRFPVFPDDHPARETVAGHVLIVAEIILRHDEWDLSRRQQDCSRHHFCIAVFIGLLMRNVVKFHENITFRVHGVQDL